MLCKRCNVNPPRANELYCKECRKAVLAELREAGYLVFQPWGFTGAHRTAEQREDIRETKYGRD